MLPQFPLLGPAISTGPLFRRPGHQSKVYSALREKLTFRTLLGMSAFYPETDTATHSAFSVGLATSDRVGGIVGFLSVVGHDWS
jgi:hypothetical protein